MNHHLYVLRSNKFGRHYIGIARDVDRRLAQHNLGEVRSTRAYRPWEVIHSEVYPDRSSARAREVHLKRSYQARQEIFQQALIV